MSRSRSLLAVLGTAGTIVALTAFAPAATAVPDAGATSTAGGVRAAGELVTVRVGQALTTPTAVTEAAGPSSAKAATFNVTYTGFTPQARTAFQRAVDIWATKITSSVPITVNARFTPLGSGVLGSAGPSSVWRDFQGAPKAGTWYVDAAANKRAGQQLGSTPDINANFSSNFSNWHYGAGNAPAGKYDFTSVVLHELGHGLGFLGAGNASGSTGTVRLSGFPIAYDRFTEQGSGKKLLTIADPSAALKTALTSNNVFMDSPKVRSDNGGDPAKLYTPGSWQQGSSYSHLDESTFGPGDPDSLMTPQIGSGETIRNPGAISVAVLKTVGW